MGSIRQTHASLSLWSRAQPSISSEWSSSWKCARRRTGCLQQVFLVVDEGMQSRAVARWYKARAWSLFPENTGPEWPCSNGCSYTIAGFLWPVTATGGASSLT
eukprot:11156386-Lingulodinium_polyedra.AAC.1